MAHPGHVLSYFEYVRERGQPDGQKLHPIGVAVGGAFGLAVWLWSQTEKTRSSHQQSVLAKRHLARSVARRRKRMARKVFYCFHYQADGWRVSQVRNMGVVEGSPLLSDNEWEKVERGGDTAIRAWIDEQMKGTSCAVVLIGNKTAGRKWVKYEIKSAWNAKKGVLGIYIHNLKDRAGQQATKGKNPFDDFTLENSGAKLSTVVKAHDPGYTMSQNVYNHIKANLAAWVEEAIASRAKYGKIA